MVHDNNAVAHRQRLFLIVRDIDKGDAGALLNAFQLDLHVLAQLEVERTERLIEQQHARLAYQRTRDSDTLLLTAGQAGYIAVFKAAQTDQLEHFRGLAFDIRAVQFFDVQTERDILRNIQVRKQRVALENRVDLTLIRRNVVQTLAVEEHIAGIRLLKAADNAQRGRFAAAGRTEQRHELTALDGQRNAAQHRRSVKFFFQVLQIDQILVQLSSLSPKQVTAPNRAGQALFGVTLYLL